MRNSGDHRNFIAWSSQYFEANPVWLFAMFDKESHPVGRASKMGSSNPGYGASV